MIIKDVTFKSSYANVLDCPSDGKPEFAFIGRSNVGKSSLINMLTNKKGLAKVSVTPGKTQLINFFDINEQWYLVDLPGYGYARASKAKKAVFGNLIQSYFLKRDSLLLAFILIDVRHPLQEIDRQFINWCGLKEVPFSIIYTKSDKLAKNLVHVHIQAIQNELLRSWQALPPQFVTSSEKKEGREEVLDYIKSVMELVVSSPQSPNT